MLSGKGIDYTSRSLNSPVSNPLRNPPLRSLDYSSGRHNVGGISPHSILTNSQERLGVQSGV